MDEHIVVIKFKPQPTGEKNADGSYFWKWEDCQWMDGGLGFPKSGIEDYSPYAVGDSFYSNGKKVKVTSVDVDRIRINGRKQWAWIISTTERMR